MKPHEIDKVQFVRWWRWPNFKFWAYPVTYKKHESLKGKPIFWGLYLGVFEIRIFPKREK